MRSHCMMLVCAGVWLAGSAAQGKELLKNRTFKDGDLEPWWIASAEEKVGEMDWEATDGVLRIRVGRPTAPHYYRLAQPVKIKEGRNYTLSFEAKSDANDLPDTPIGVGVCQRHPNWDSYGLRESAVLESSWKKYEYTFTASEIDKKNEPVLRLYYGHVKGNVFFRDFSLTDDEPGGRGLGRTALPPPRKP